MLTQVQMLQYVQKYYFHQVDYTSDKIVTTQIQISVKIEMTFPQILAIR